MIGKNLRKWKIDFRIIFSKTNQTEKYMNLFEENDEIKPLFRLGDLALVKIKNIDKYQKKEEKLEFLEKNGYEKLGRAWHTLQEEIDKEYSERTSKKKGITNERQSIIKEFLDELNKERKDTKYKPLTATGVAMKLSLLKSNQELYGFLSECKDYKKRSGSFGKRFFGGHKTHDWSK